MQLLAAGVNFKSAPIECLEKLSFSDDQTRDTLRFLTNKPSIYEMVILSTCNRIEFYAIVPDLELGRQALIAHLKEMRGLTPYDLDCFYFHENQCAAEHLYRVASGVDSLVFGETQILGQIKHALSLAQSSGASSTVFNSLFRFAIETGKRIQTETDLNQGAISVGSVAVNLAHDTFGSLKDRTVLLVGAGQMGELVARHLLASGVQNLLVCNRSPEKAKQLAENLPAKQVDFEHFRTLISDVDMVMTCTSSPHYLLTLDDVASLPDRKSPLLLIDLSLPRNIDPATAQLSGVKVYDILRLQETVHTNQSQRLSFLPQVEAIIDQEMERFLTWYRSLNVTPTIQAFQGHLEMIRQGEIRRAIAKYGAELDDTSLDILEVVTRSMIQKLVFSPADTLRNTEDPQLRYDTQAALKRLFALEDAQFTERYTQKKAPSAADACPFAHYQYDELKVASDAPHETTLHHR